MLYLVATPIGNLQDITLRAVELLGQADYILCEDTRHSQILLKHLGLQKPLKSYHKFNEAQREQSLLEDLRAGKEIALISDAGTPGISDPAQRLVQRCKEEGLPVSAAPGACAAIVALTLSGLNTERFQFLGFVPRQPGARAELFRQALIYPGSSIFYESPKRLLKTLEHLAKLAPTAKVAVARELTKKFEEVEVQEAADLWRDWQDRSVKGECVLILDGGQLPLEGTPVEWVQDLQSRFDLDKKEAIKLVAQLFGLPKAEVYRDTLDEQ